MFTVAVIMIFLIGCSVKENAAGQQTIKGKTVEEVMAKSGRNISYLLHKENVRNGVLAFYLPDIGGDTEAASEMGLEYLEEVFGGFKMSYRGGAYTSSID